MMKADKISVEWEGLQDFTKAQVFYVAEGIEALAFSFEEKYGVSQEAFHELYDTLAKMLSALSIWDELGETRTPCLHQCRHHKPVDSCVTWDWEEDDEEAE